MLGFFYLCTGFINALHLLVEVRLPGAAGDEGDIELANLSVERVELVLEKTSEARY